MTAASVDDWGSATAHPTTADLERRAARQRALTASQRNTQQNDALTEKKPVEVEARHLLDPEVARGFPMFDGARGMPGGATIPGTRPGDKWSELEKANREVARVLAGRERRTITA